MRYSKKPLLIILVILTGMAAMAQPKLKPVELLHDNYHRSKFLKAVHQWNEGVQYYEDSVMAATGWGSDQHQLAMDSIKIVDSLLTVQVDQYLDRYGFPNKENFGELLRITPWLILNRCSNTEIRHKHFSVLYKAYRDGHLEQRRLLMFLERSYEIVHRKNFRSYAVEEARIGELMQELDLMPLKARKLMQTQ